MKSNYEIMRDSMQKKFLKYDQEHMIEKFNLKYDEDYLYIRFCKDWYRIHRRTGKVEGSPDHFASCTDAGYNETMSIFDVLCDSKEGCSLSGRFCNMDQLKGTVRSAGPGSGLFVQQVRCFDGKTAMLGRACEALGGEKRTIGDVSYCLYPFDFLPMMLQFWNSDEEFPANLKIMWDENVLDYVRYETTFFIVSHMLSCIKERMDAESVQT